MKKMFTLIAAMATAMTINAQSITFGETAYAAGSVPAEWSDGALKLTLTDTAGKLVVDANNAHFGTADANTSYAYRLKSGGKSSSKLNFTLTVPSAGTVKIAARTGSNSATDRNVIATQDGTELLNKVVQESDATMVTIGEAETKVYPYLTFNAEAGDIAITFPTGSINFYAISFEASTSTGISKVGTASADATYNLSGQRVGKGYKGVVISNGKKTLRK